MSMGGKNSFMRKHTHLVAFVGEQKVLRFQVPVADVVLVVHVLDRPAEGTGRDTGTGYACAPWVPRQQSTR